MLKNLKSLFFVEDEDSAKKSKATKAKGGSKQAVKVTPSSQKSTAQSTVTNIKGTTSAKFMEILFKAIENNNLEGFDYLEFRNSLLSLKKMQMDEKTRFQSAAAMAQTMGVAPDAILSSAQHYLSVLKNEEVKFQEALSNQRQMQIGNKENDIKKLDQIVKQKSTQIQQLQKEIEADQKKAATLSKQIENATVKVKKTSADFEASYHSVVDQIADDVSKIKNYLQNKNQ
jgi:hypothetical protein